MIFNKNIDIPVRDLKGAQISPEVLKYVPEESAAYYKFVPLAIKDGVLEVGLVDPDRIEARDAIAFIASKHGVPFRIFLISEEDFIAVLESYKGITGEVEKALGVLKREKEEEAATKKGGGSDGEVSEELMKEISSKKTESAADEAPITKIVAVIIQHATEGNASDIHIEPTTDRVKVRFRVDGVLYNSLNLPIDVLDAIVARIKVLANMKLDEKRIPQDGRFSAKVEGRQIDFRVSSFPTYYGEKVVLRILDSEKGAMTLDKLGFNKSHLEAIKTAINKPYGLILITGPTGSGKTTTLYAMLNTLDRQKMNVISLEDPIEYNVEGVSQSQVRPEIKYTFASGLRSVLRQDPDVIMVGEIRDEETARLAIQAALTGHLVLSTLHTNNAVAAVTRLVDMGIEPYLIAPTLVLVLAQRLVGTICQESKSPLPVEGAIKNEVESILAGLPEAARKGIRTPEIVYAAKPSATCSTGTRGRTAVAEALEVDNEIQNVILKRPQESEIWAEARRKGMITLKEDALIKAFSGEIAFDEVGKL
ncbi:MAG: GspE/PulE family protein [Candidatus Paceibacterota bacterium]|jgi:type IV pilus assembly protein PilB